MNVLVIDYMGESTEWLAVYGKKDLNIIYTITPESKYWSKYLEKREYDVILVFEADKRQLISAIVELFKLEEERIIYARDVESWRGHKWSAYSLLNEDNSLFRLLDYYTETQKRRKYTSCTVEDLSYVGYAGDAAIMLEMNRLQENWSKLEMEIFYGLASNFYDLSGRSYFLDLGANIGTTSIYFKKKLDADIKLLAFEPDPETYRLLRANFIINEMPEDSILENYGLADKEGDLLLNRSSENPGANSVITDYGGEGVAVHLLRLDDYIVQKGINPSEIKYIWIDTEGFEAQLFMGMRNLLATQKIPILVEWNPHCYVFTDLFDDFVHLLIDNFAGYIDVKEVKDGNITVHKMDELWKFKGYTCQTDLFLIK